MSKPIIKRIKKLEGVGIFESYQHGKDDKTPEFQKYNLIYGFNGSGKTTLSRLFQYLDGDGSSPPDTNLGEFVFGLDNGQDAGSKKGTEGLAGRVLVFNTDFVRDNLKWDDSQAQPVVYLGKDSTRIVSLLDQIERYIDNSEESRTKVGSSKRRVDRDLRDFHTDTARIVRDMLNEQGYDARRLKEDYEAEEWKNFSLLTDKKRSQLIELIRQIKPHDQLFEPRYSIYSLKNILREAKLACETAISDLTLQEMQNHPSMISWLKQGCEYHQEKDLGTCLFCGNEISEDRIKALKDGLDEKIDQFFGQLEDIEEKLKKEKEAIDSVISNLPGKSDISNRFAESYSQSIECFNSAIAKVQEVIEETRSSVISKRQQVNISNWPDHLCQSEIDKILDDSVTAFQVVVSCIEEHNKEQREFEEEQQDARKKLKFSVLQEYKVKREELEKLTNAVGKLYEIQKRSDRKLVDYKEALNQQISTHGPAVEKINRLLRDYLGHEEIQLTTSGNGYQILYRGNEMKGQISEGERTAVALCYFLSKLGSNLKEAERIISEQIVVIDDPISSLDSGSLNYAFNLLRERMKKAGQLFILTHNLNFMNEVKKWLKNQNRNENRSRVENSRAGCPFFFIRTYQEGEGTPRQAVIEKMSQLLINHDSEYHYFFYLVKKGLAQSMTHQNIPGHVMPHVIRRVLESFLAFKVPITSMTALKHKLNRLRELYPEIGENYIAVLASERLSQLESHSDNMDDFLGFPPMTVEETERAANALMKLMETVDKKHFDIMCKQVGG